MTEMDLVRTQSNMKWILGTFDQLMEASRSAPTDQTKSAMLSIVGQFSSLLQLPNRQRATLAIPNEHKTFIDKWKRSQDKFEQWMRLLRKTYIITSFLHCFVTTLQSERNKGNYQECFELLRRFYAKWSQIAFANSQDGAEFGLADEYKTLLDELERLNDEVQGWVLRETPALGEA